MRELITNGNELVALAAIDAGCKFFGGYPITPSSEIAHSMSVLLPKNNGTFIQMEDEISGICVALGASMSGVKAMTASSGPGISLKSEQIGYAFMTETPLVIVDVMRGGPSTGLPTRVSQGDIGFIKHPTHGDFQAIVIAPSSLEEIYFQTIKAFNLAEELMSPVCLILKIKALSFLQRWWQRMPQSSLVQGLGLVYLKCCHYNFYECFWLRRRFCVTELTCYFQVTHIYKKQCWPVCIMVAGSATLVRAEVSLLVTETKNESQAAWLSLSLM